MEILNKLQKVYGRETGSNLEKEIVQLVEQYKENNDFINSRTSLWDEKDIVLITYADQIKEKNTPTLQTFKKFYNKWFADLFNITHFLPFFPYSSDDGFSVIDYKEIHEDAGNWEDVRRFSENSNLMIDFVCNHASQYSPYFEGFLNNEPEYKDFFVTVSPETDLSMVTRPRATPLLTPFKFKDGEVRHVWTTFSDDQVDLNFANPKVLLWAIDVLLYYISQGGRYIRLDAVGYLWKEIGTSSIHLWQTHEIIKIFRDVVELTETGTKLITETNVPHKDNISYFGNGEDEAHMVYQFPLPPLMLLSIKEENAEALTEWAKSLVLPSEKATFFNFLASHDGIGLNPLRGLVAEERILDIAERVQKNGGLVSYKTNSDGSQSPYELNVSYIDALADANDTIELKVQKMKLAHSILLSLKGIPAIYVQSILGGTNDLDGVKATKSNRSINREKYNYEDLKNELTMKESLRGQVYTGLSEMLEVKKNQSALHPDADMIVLEVYPELFVIKRRIGKEEFLSINNVSNKTIQASFEELSIEKGTDLFNQNEYTEGVITVKPFDFKWLKLIN